MPPTTTSTPTSGPIFSDLTAAQTAARLTGTPKLLYTADGTTTTVYPDGTVDAAGIAAPAVTNLPFSLVDPPNWDSVTMQSSGLYFDVADNVPYGQHPLDNTPFVLPALYYAMQSAGMDTTAVAAAAPPSGGNPCNGYTPNQPAPDYLNIVEADLTAIYQIDSEIFYYFGVSVVTVIIAIVIDLIILLVDLFSGKPVMADTLQMAQNLMGSQNMGGATDGAVTWKIADNLNIPISTSDPAQQQYWVRAAHQFHWNFAIQGVDNATILKVRRNIINNAANKGWKRPKMLDAQIPTGLKYYIQNKHWTDASNVVAASLASGDDNKTAAKKAMHHILQNAQYTAVKEWHFDTTPCSSGPQPPSPQCPPGEHIKLATGLCTPSGTMPTCPQGWQYDQALEVCVQQQTPIGPQTGAQPTCPTGTTLDPQTGLCQPGGILPQCGPGYVYDIQSQTCIQGTNPLQPPPVCPVDWTWNPQTEQCDYTPANSRQRRRYPPNCPAGYSWSDSAQACIYGQQGCIPNPPPLCVSTGDAMDDLLAALYQGLQGIQSVIGSGGQGGGGATGCACSPDLQNIASQIANLVAQTKACCETGGANVDLTTVNKMITAIATTLTGIDPATLQAVPSLKATIDALVTELAGNGSALVPVIKAREDGTARVAALLSVQHDDYGMDDALFNVLSRYYGNFPPGTP